MVWDELAVYGMVWYRMVCYRGIRHTRLYQGVVPGCGVGVCDMGVASGCGIRLWHQGVVSGGGARVWYQGVVLAGCGVRVCYQGVVPRCGIRAWYEGVLSRGGALAPTSYRGTGHKALPPQPL